jgi:Na+/proline symporter
MILASFGLIDWGVLALYWVAMIYMGVIAARKDQNTQEYFLGRRSLPTWAVAISVVATSLSAATFIGAPEEAYKRDVSYLILNLGGFMAVIVVATLFVPKLYRAGTITIYGFLEQRLGPAAKVATSCMFLFGRLLASGARLFMAAIPLCLLLFGTGTQQAHEHTGQLILSICLIGLTGTFYTMMGGIRTIVWIDVVQFSLVVGTVLLSIGMLLYKIPLDLPQIIDVLSRDGTGPRGSKLHLVDFTWDLSQPYTFWSATLGAVFLSTAAFGVDHDLAQRFLVARSPVRGGLSLIYSQLMSIVVVALFLVVGLLLWLYYQWLPSQAAAGAGPTAMPPTPKDAYPVFLLNELPPVFGGLAIAGFFAIAQGSMDSAINALASSLVADLYYPLRRRLGKPIDQRVSVRTPKVAVVVMGVVMCLFAIVCAFAYNPKVETLLQFALGIMSFAYTGMLGVFLTALLTRRGNATSVLLALACGVLTVVLMQDRILAWWTQRLLGRPYTLAMVWWMPFGTAVSFLVCVAGSPRRQPATMHASASIDGEASRGARAPGGPGEEGP